MKGVPLRGSQNKDIYEFLNIFSGTNEILSLFQKYFKITHEKFHLNGYKIRSRQKYNCLFLK